jgi:hypothetical protein
MPKKSCANCFFFVKFFNRNPDGKLLMRRVTEDEREAFKNLDLDELDTSFQYKCWKGMWQETAYPSEEFVRDTILKNRSKFIIADSCFFLNKDNKHLEFKTAEIKVEERKDNLSKAFQLILTFIIALASIITIFITLYG